jgi:hypothetical protein
MARMQTLSNHAGVAKPCKADAILQHLTRFNRGKQHVGTQLNQISYVVNAKIIACIKLPFSATVSTVSSSTQQEDVEPAMPSSNQQMQTSDETAVAATLTSDTLELAEKDSTHSNSNEHASAGLVATVCTVKEKKGSKRARSKSAPRHSTTDTEPTQACSVSKRTTRERKPKRYEDYDYEDGNRTSYSVTLLFCGILLYTKSSKCTSFNIHIHSQ